MDPVQVDVVFRSGLILVAVVASVVGVRRWLQHRDRRADLWALSHALGWTMTGRTYEFDGWQFPPFNSSGVKTGDYKITGRYSSRDMSVFDFTVVSDESRYARRETVRWSTDFSPLTDLIALGSSGAGPSESQRLAAGSAYTVVVVDVPAWFPQTVVSQERAHTRVWGALTADDIRLESEKFNRAFRVVGKDRKFAMDLLSPRVMERLLRKERSITIGVQARTFVVVQKGRQKPERIKQMIRLADWLLDSLPRHQWDAYGSAEAAESRGESTPVVAPSFEGHGSEPVAEYPPEQWIVPPADR
jgi:hypothetical protein